MTPEMFYAFFAGLGALLVLASCALTSCTMLHNTKMQRRFESRLAHLTAKMRAMEGARAMSDAQLSRAVSYSNLMRRAAATEYCSANDWFDAPYAEIREAA